jgi:hypothetical protein
VTLVNACFNSLRLGPPLKTAEMDHEYTTLRTELKSWEKEFKSKNGRAATPDDIRLVDGLGR